MKAIAITVCAAAAAWCTIGTVHADDAALTSSSRLSSKVERDINQVAGTAADTPANDVDSRIKDLDATRAAIDKQKAPAVSLSVSGWINQDVQYKVK